MDDSSRSQGIRHRIRVAGKNYSDYSFSSRGWIGHSKGLFAGGMSLNYPVIGYNMYLPNLMNMYETAHTHINA